MYWTQQRATNVLLLVQFVLCGMITAFLFWGSSSAWATWGNTVLIATVVFGLLYWAATRGWKIAGRIELILLTGSVALLTPEPYVSQHATITIFLPSILALLLTDSAAWVFGCFVAVLATLIARGGLAVYGEPVDLSLMLMGIGGLVLARFSFTTALRQVAEAQQQAQAHAAELAHRNRELYLSEQRFATLFAQSPAAIAIIASADWRIVNVNQRMSDMLGYAPEALADRTVKEIGLWENSPGNALVLGRARAGGGSRDEEILFRTSGGEQRQALISLEPIELAGEPYMVAMLVDITERQRAAQLRDLERQFFQSLSNTTPLAPMLELLCALVERQISNALCSILLLDESKNWLVAGAAPSLPPAYMRQLARVPVGPTNGSCGTAASRNAVVICEDIASDPLWLEWRALALRFDLRACWSVPFCDANGRPIGTFAVYSTTIRTPSSSELTVLSNAAHLASVAVERERIESELRRSEMRFRAIINHAVDLVFSVDANSFVRFASPSVETIMGLPVSEIIGTDAYSYLHEDEVSPLRQQFADLVGTPDGVIVLPNVRLRHASGEWRVIEMIGSNTLNDPAVNGFVINCRDITERRQLEAQLMQSQKLESIGRLAGGIAHDFNNIITAVTGYADIALLAAEDGEPVHEELREIQHAARRAALLTRQLLTFARQQPVESQLLNVNTLLGDIDKLLRRLISERIEFVSHLQAGLATVRADAGQLEQVLINLVVNAADAMPEGGRLTVETTNIALDDEYTRQHSPLIPGNYVLLSVTDTGTGMAEDVQQHVFEPFFSTKERGRGTGLGLAMCHGIVQKHGGHIWFYSEPGHGTVFHIYLPTVIESSGEMNLPLLPIPSPRGCETVLLVEDEAPVRTLAARVLTSLGYNVLTACDGRDGLAMAHGYSGSLDLLLTDVVMPRMGGKDMALELIKDYPSLGVLFMSGYTGRIVLGDGMAGVHYGYLQKPFSSATLAQKVRDVLDLRNHDDNRISDCAYTNFEP